jgi:enterochelin esterase-like enzyme
MNLDILSINLVIYLCVIFSVLSFYIISTLYNSGLKKPLRGRKAKIKKLKLKKLNRLFFLSALLLSASLAVFILLLTSYLTSSTLPKSFILMCMPFTLMLSVLLLALIVKRKLRWLAFGATVLGLLFSLVIINDYYRYYPTLGQVFGITDARDLNLNSVTIHYTVPANQNAYNNQSVEGSLNKVLNTPNGGTLYKLTIPGTVSHFQARTGYVYEPPIYSSSAQVKLPVMVLTEGVPGLPDNWIGMGMTGVLDQFAKDHDGITPLVFVADDTECVNSPRGNVETYFSVDVPNYIKNNFRVDTSPRNWAMGGLSLGGMCSVMITLRHPDVYNYFIDLGGGAGPEIGSTQDTINTLFGGSQSAWAAHQPLLLMQKKSYPQIGGFFADGNQDESNVTSAISQLSQASKKAKINSVTEFVNGAHTFNVWNQTFKDALPWASNRIGATSCDSSCL